jgi:photosystem II stability/assembly factor-like uncharacterized protein
MIDQRYRDLAGAAEDAARPPEFAAVRRRAGRLRARRRAGGALAAAVLVASGTAGVAALRPAGETWDAATGGGRILSSGAADAKHLYAITADCGGCPRELVASDDGGRTWERRSQLEGVAGLATLTVLGPDVMMSSGVLGPDAPIVPPNSEPLPPEPSATEDPYAARGPVETTVSVDGGRTWRKAQLSDKPVAAVPAGMRAVDRQTAYFEGEATRHPGKLPLYAVDPASGQVAPLAKQPPLEYPQVVDVPAVAGLWAVGADPDTDKPAVSVSRDRGRTWKTTVFRDARPAIVEMRDKNQGNSGPAIAYGVSLPQMATTDGTVAYLQAASDGGSGRKEGPVTYRTADGGAEWERTSDTAPAGSPAMVTADGTHVLTAADGSGYQYLGSRDGRTYTRVELAGLPALGRAPRAITDRFFLFQSEDGLFTSTDGWSWRRVRSPLG